jgi:hypothetical protein
MNISTHLGKWCNICWAKKCRSTQFFFVIAKPIFFKCGCSFTTRRPYSSRNSCASLVPARIAYAMRITAMTEANVVRHDEKRAIVVPFAPRDADDAPWLEAQQPTTLGHRGARSARKNAVGASDIGSRALRQPLRISPRARPRCRCGMCRASDPYRPGRWRHATAVLRHLLHASTQNTGK